MRTSLLVACALSLGSAACVEQDQDEAQDLAEIDRAATVLPATVRVNLTRQTGVTGTQRINLGLPLPPGLLSDANLIRVGTRAMARRVLARWPDGSLRSVQIQFAVTSSTIIDIQLGVASTAPALTLVEVSTTLMQPDGKTGPKVWATLPATWLAQSGVAGPMLARSAIAGTQLDAWQVVCDHDRWNTDVFVAQQADRGAWLFDRPTAMYRGYAYHGRLSVLRSAYREAAIYRAGITGTGTATRIGVPGASSDLKYHYTQGMALHYLLTGDTRFREAAENVAIRAHALWTDPGYDGAADFWTERHAGFALLAYEWAAAVSDDRPATFTAWSDEAVTAYLAMQGSASAACFAHHADAHGEDYGYVGCSPWMSAILADGLDAYATRAGGSKATSARTGLARLGRMIATQGRDGDGRPYYWMGVGTGAGQDEPDDYDEHWGESAYVVALAWHRSGRTDASLRTAALELVDGLDAFGEAGQLRSFNWQCRSAIMTPGLLAQ